MIMEKKQVPVVITYKEEAVYARGAFGAWVVIRSIYRLGELAEFSVSQS